MDIGPLTNLRFMSCNNYYLWDENSRGGCSDASRMCSTLVFHRQAMEITPEEA